ncbi:MAG: hypothetical protein CM1200mP28_04990 [Deltaproteobacteria bacterium]|nr:MAG: hypothetical protein CM1200mP28_04990 [Deltaproteobacteria bacterium]
MADENFGTKVFKIGYSRVSLKAFKKRAASIKGKSPRILKPEQSPKPCNPPWVTNPLGKSRQQGVLKGFYPDGFVAMANPRKNMNPPIKREDSER